jgi:hypothetical protein
MIEANGMRSQIATTSKINLRLQPLAFTEPSAVLRSARAVRVKDMKALPPVTKRKIGFFTGED